MGLSLAGEGRTDGDGGPDDDQGRFAGLGFGRGERIGDCHTVIAVGNFEDLPAVSFIALADIFGESDVGIALDGNVIIIVKHDQLAQFQGAGQGSCFAGDPFHQAAVANKCVGVMVDDLEIGAVEPGGQMSLADRHTDRRCHALTERPSCHFDTDSVTEFRMARRLAAPLAERLQIIQGQAVAEQVKQRIEQHRGVAGAQHEAVAVDPLRIGRIVVHDFRPQGVCHRCGPHWFTGMARLGFLDTFRRQDADRVDG